MPTFGLVSRKGGVGKSTLALGVAAALARKFRRPKVLLIDADPQGTVSDWGRLRDDDPAPFRIKAMPYEDMHHDAIRMAAEHDFTVIDAPPHEGKINRSALIASDVVVIPVEPSGFSTWAADKTVEQVREAEVINPAIKCGIVVSRKIANTVLGRDIRDMTASLGVPLLNTEVMQRVQFAEAGTLGLTIFEHAPQSAAAREIELLTQEIERMLRRG